MLKGWLLSTLLPYGQCRWVLSIGESGVVGKVGL